MEFLEKALVMAVHDAQRARHGGAPGVRDEALLDAALARARGVYEYGIDDAFALAAALALDLAARPAFVDANKRTAWVCARVFLRLNGVELTVAPTEAVEALVQLAEGGLDEAGFADWLARRAVDAV